LKISRDYVAGFFDGEGSVRLIEGKQRYNSVHNIAKEYRCLRVGLIWTNTNYEVIVAIKEFLGVGRICCSSGTNIRHASCYRLFVQNHEDCLKITNKLIPLTIVKREKLVKLVEAIENWSWRVPKIDKEVLEKLYIKEQLFLKDIAKRLGSKRQTIAWYLKKYNIPKRSYGETLKLRWRRAMFLNKLC